MLCEVRIWAMEFARVSWSASQPKPSFFFFFFFLLLFPWLLTKNKFGVKIEPYFSNPSFLWKQLVRLVWKNLRNIL